MPLYFAYGSNMDREGMAGRCPRARLIGLARLPRHRFFIMSEGYASIMRDPRRAVLGALWDVPFADIPSLDRYEQVSAGLYSKITQPVVIEDKTLGGAKRALVYVGRSARPGKPKPGYLELVLQSARSLGLPDSYLYELEHGEPAPRKAGTPLFKAPM
jgi:hypothetical protein